MAKHTITIDKKRLFVFLALFFFVDFAFIVLHSIEALTSSIDNSLYSLYEDAGYSEIYQYIKWFWIILLLFFLILTDRSINYSAWILVFTYILCDDAFEIHETLGRHVAEHLTFLHPLGLRIQDIGELIVFGSAGFILLFFIVFSYIRGTEKFKRISKDILLLLFVSAFTSIFLDIAHSSIHIGRITTGILGVAEDGGEMFAASLILYYILVQCIKKQEENFSFFDNFILVPLKRRLKND